MFPPSAPIYWNTKPRWYGDPIISLARLKELKMFRNLKIERIRTNDGIPEYMEICSDGEYYNIRVIRDAIQYGHGYHSKDLMDTINWLYEHGWGVGL